MISRESEIKIQRTCACIRMRWVEMVIEMGRLHMHWWVYY